MSSELILDALIAATAVVSVAWLAAVAARRAPAALRNTLWRMALVGFWVAPAIVIATHAAPWQPHTIAVPLLPAAQEARQAMPPGSDLSTTAASLSPTSTMPHQPTAPEPTPPPRHVPPVSLLLLLWAAGVALGIVYLIKDLRAVRRLILATRPFDDPALQQRAAALAAQLGLRTSPALAASSAISTPTVAGQGVPVLLLPENFSSAPGGDDAVIVHELAHIRRGDLLVYSAARLTRALWWWHPLAWLMARELVLSAEEACDDWAVALTGQRTDYATTLVDWAEAATAVAGLPCAPRGRALVKRVRHILQSTQAPRLHLSWQARTILAVCAVAMVVLVGSVHLRAVPADEIMLAQAGEEAAQPESGHTVTVQGKVLGPDGAPVSGADVAVRYSPRPRSKLETAHHTLSSADGSFSLRLQVADLKQRIRLTALKQGMALDWAVGGLGDQYVLRLADNPDSCAGLVTDLDGKPISGAKVWVRLLLRTSKSAPAASPSQEAPDNNMRQKPFSNSDQTFLATVTDAEGKFKIGGLPPGTRIAIGAHAEGTALSEGFVVLFSNSQDIAIALPPEGIISGHVTHNGKPVPGVRVICKGFYSRATMLRPPVTLNVPSFHFGLADTTSAADGSYTFDKLPPTIFNVMLIPPQGLTAKALEGVTLKPGQHLTGCDLRLTPGGLVEGVVMDAQTKRPLADICVVARGPARPETSTLVETTQTDENGRYSLRLPQGENRLYISRGERYEQAERKVSVVEGETLIDINLLLPPKVAPPEEGI